VHMVDLTLYAPTGLSCIISRHFKVGRQQNEIQFVHNYMTVGLVRLDAADNADPLLQALIGQTCSHDSGQAKVVYTIDQKNGQWAVRDLYGATHPKPF
jgi:hypothetical protein